MREIKNKQQHKSGKLMLVVAFILALLPFSHQLSSISGQKSSVKTELVTVKKSKSKRTVSFQSASRHSIQVVPLRSLSVITGLSVLHSHDAKRIKEHGHYPDTIHRLRCCQPKIISSSDEDPSFLS